MKKKLILLGALLALLTACGQEAPDATSENFAQQEEGSAEDTTEVGDVEEIGEDADAESSTLELGEDQTLINIYSIGEDGTLQSTQIAWTRGDDQAIWDELQASRILNEESEWNSTTVTEEDKTIILDVNHGFGEFIRGFGTAGEQEIIACVVNTFLEAYQYEGMKITEEQEPLMTGHRELDSYMGIQTL